jgi:hypothetical protein
MCIIFKPLAAGRLSFDKPIINITCLIDKKNMVCLNVGSNSVGIYIIFGYYLATL